MTVPLGGLVQCFPKLNSNPIARQWKVHIPVASLITLSTDSKSNYQIRQQRKLALGLFTIQFENRMPLM